MRRRRHTLLPAAGLCLATIVVAAGPAPAAPTAGSAGVTSLAAGHRVDRPAVIGSRVIGHSVRDRPIRAFHLGQPERAGRTIVAIGAMHGNEQQSAHPLAHLRDHRPIRGADLWVVPVMNPDGYLRGQRKNAHGIDLNRNFPVRWVDLDGDYESGPRPRSEPETRAMMRFLTAVDPDHVVSLHQPLFGVDPRTKNPVFARRLAREMHLPTHRIDCGGVCHGTMTQWFNRRRDGDAITAELAAQPTARYLRDVAPNGILRTIGGTR